MKHWPPSQISQLEKLWSNGMSIRKIAKEMQRTPGSIAGKIFKLNLQRRKQKITIIDGVPKTNTTPTFIAIGRLVILGHTRILNSAVIQEPIGLIAKSTIT